MHIDINPLQMVAVADLLNGRNKKAVELVCDVLAHIGVCLTLKDDGSFEFETMINRAKRLVVEELMKCVSK